MIKELLQKNTIIKSSLILALLLIVFVLSNILITSLSFIFGYSVGYWQPVMAIVITIALTVFLLRREGYKKVLLALAVLAVLISSSLLITSVTSDDTVDGTAYHEPAVGAMRYGWNPVYQSVGEFNDSGKSPVTLSDRSYEKWVNHYPKGHWIYGANLYKLTGNMEMGRSMVILIVYAFFLLALSYFSTRFKTRIAVLLAALIALNPISAAQLFSYYNDGMMANLLFMLILLFTMAIDKKYVYGSVMRYVLLASALALIINTKFTGFVYAGIYSATYFAFIVLNKSTREKWWRYAIAGFAGLVVGVFVIGLSVYPKNFTQHGNPFYPLIGSHDTADIITSNQPASFGHTGTLKKLFISNFSETANISEASGDAPVLKPPFTFNLSELPFLSYADPRIAGYGVWFSGILTISVLYLIYVAIRTVVKDQWRHFWLIALPLAPTVFLLIGMSDAWWARYFPQMYLFPMIALIILIATKRKILTQVLVFTMLFNLTLLLSIQVRAQYDGVVYKDSELHLIDKLTENGKYTPKVFVNGYGGYAYRYYDRYGKIEMLPGVIKGKEADSVTLSKYIVVYK